MDVSFVIPVFNEENSLKELHDRINTQIKPLTENYDIIFVDDARLSFTDCTLSY